MPAEPVDFRDIQGLVRFGYNALTEASFLLLRISDAADARAWLNTAPISTAEELDRPPLTALQVAFTREGLEAIGVSEDLLKGFSAEFLSGMTGQESRSRRLGDVGANSTQAWQWGRPGDVPHALVMIYAQPGHLDEWTRTVQNGLWSTAFKVTDRLSTSDLGGKEPFGFNDGISQPALDWKRQRTPRADELEYGNLSSLGEFLLGYPNEYGKYTDRPLVPDDAPSSSILLHAEDQPGKRDLGRNGTFLVFRQLKQDVQGFWRFVDGRTGSNPQARQHVGESMVGRKMDGTPLLPVSAHPIMGIDAKASAQNQFTYDSDGDGVRCPFGAHIRRANPRNADLPASSGLLDRLMHMLGFGNASYRDDVIASTRFHRMIRRGREYGPRLAADEALAGPTDTAEHGIHFICLAANILRQFEFVQNSWVMNTKFDALTEQSDPLIGNRAEIAGCPLTDSFVVPRQGGVRIRMMGMPQFVTVRGGAYFFLPSIRALRFVAAMGHSR